MNFTDLSLPETLRRSLTRPTVLSDPTLGQAVNDAARKIRIRGKQVIVPLKFDEKGEIAAPDHLVLKRLTLEDLRFLKAWRLADWNLEKAVEVCRTPPNRIELLVKRLSCFRQEDAQVKALAEIPTPDWIAAKHVQNVYQGGTLEDSEHKSLAELAKIEGAYKQQAPTNQLNVFNISLTAEQEAALKPVFDTIASENSHVAA